MKSDKCCRHQRHFLIARKLMDENRCTVDQNVRKSLKLTSGWVSTSKKNSTMPKFHENIIFSPKNVVFGSNRAKFFETKTPLVKHQVISSIRIILVYQKPFSDWRNLHSIVIKNAFSIFSCKCTHISLYQRISIFPRNSVLQQGLTAGSFTTSQKLGEK